MEPIRGPLDYHRYPPRTRQPQPFPTASMSSFDPTPHQPRRRTASSRPVSGPNSSPDSPGSTGSSGERVLRRPHERQAHERRAQAEIEPIVVPAEHAALDSEAYNDWLEGRHRGPGARRRNRRAALDAARHADASGSHSTNRATGDRGTGERGTGNRVTGNQGTGDRATHHGSHEETAAGSKGVGKKPRHLRRLWESRRKMEKPALRRFRTPFWKIARRITIGLLVVGAGELVVAALTTPRLAVQSVVIEGAQVTPEEALQPIAQQLIGQNWIRVRTRSAALAAAKLPAVKEVRIERVPSLPPMKLAVRIMERRPFARVGGGDTWWVVDREGVPFRRAGKQDEKLHAVTSPALRSAQIRLGAALPTSSWKPFVVLADALENDMKNGGQWQLRRTYLDKFGFASLRLTGGSNNELLLRLGGGQWPQKLQRARQALDYFAATGRRAAALNLVSYNMPTWTPYRPPETGDSTEDEASTTGVQEDSEPMDGTLSEPHEGEDGALSNTADSDDSGT